MSVIYVLECWRAKNMDAWNRPAHDRGTALHATIAYFYGIAIRMFFIDHPPPHFFAAYSGHEANVSIETGQVIEGHLPPNAVHLVKQWALAHRGELEDNWRRARASMPLAKIVGLDDD